MNHAVAEKAFAQQFELQADTVGELPDPGHTMERFFKDGNDKNTLALKPLKRAETSSTGVTMLICEPADSLSAQLIAQGLCPASCAFERQSGKLGAYSFQGLSALRTAR